MGRIGVTIAVLSIVVKQVPQLGVIANRDVRVHARDGDVRMARGVANLGECPATGQAWLTNVCRPS